MCTQAYHDKVVKPVFGVTDYWYRYEFAKSRGQIHWHQLSWRHDINPHQLLHEATEEGCDTEEYASWLSQWAEQNFDMTASHPVGSDENGEPRKEFWPPPEGTAEPLPDEEDPLIKMLMDIASTQDAVLEDHLQLVNRVGIHARSDYCLRTPRHPGPGLQPKERVCRMEFGSEFNRGKEPRTTPEIVKDRNGASRLELPRDHPCVIQHSRYHLQAWRANCDMSLILSKSDPDSPSTDEIIGVTDYVCGYACKGNEPTGATVDLFKDILNAVEVADEVSGRSICARMLMKPVGRRDISGPEASFELSGLALWRCSRQFSYLSLKGSRRLERNGDTATSSSSLDKYLARPHDELCSWYKFASKNGKVPVVSGGATHATWPLQEDYWRTMVHLHWPSWFTMQEVKDDETSWIERFESFLLTDDCPTFVKAHTKVLKAQRQAQGHAENIYEDDDEENEPVDAVQQPDWVDIYAGQNQCYEGVEEDFQYDDGGEEHDWSSTSLQLPEDHGAKKWLEDRIQEVELTRSENGSLLLPDMCPLTLNTEQKSIVSLILMTLQNYIEHPQDYVPLRLVVSGTGGTGKSYMIKRIQRLVRQVFGTNDAIQVITPTGNSAYLVQGSTAHSFLQIPTGAKSCNELTLPSGTVLRKIQERCKNLKVLVGDERSMFGRTMLGWMEQHMRYGMNEGANSEEPWGGVPVVVLLGDDVQLPPVCDTPTYISDSRSAPSNHGRLVWTGFDTAAELTQIIRQADSEQDPTVIPIVAISRSMECSCRCKRLQIPLRLAWGMTIHKCQGMTVGTGEPFRYIVIHPGMHNFEGKNPGVLFVALSRAKSSGGQGIDPDFPFHEDFLADEERFRAMDTATTRARAREMVRLRALTEETRNRQSLSPAYQEETSRRLVEWAQSMSQ